MFKNKVCLQNCYDLLLAKQIVVVSRNWGFCLEDPPSPEHDQYDMPEELPGLLYDADHQCRLAFGSHSKKCVKVEVRHGINNKYLFLYSSEHKKTMAFCENIFLFFLRQVSLLKLYSARNSSGYRHQLFAPALRFCLS